MSATYIEMKARLANRPTSWELKGKKILPCPFCQSEEIYIVEDDDLCWCGCGGCGVEGPYRDNRVHAVRLWQERKPSANT